MVDRLDEVDKRILYHLVQDARNTSAPMVAEEAHVSAGTIRNRIKQLEADGVIRGYHAHVDYERAEGRLRNLVIGTAEIDERERLTKQIADIPGVVNVRQLMCGTGNVHVTTVGEDAQELARVTRDVAEMGLEVEDEHLLQHEEFRPYHAFGPEGRRDRQSIADFMSLSGGAEVVEVSVTPGAEVDGMTLSEANEQGLVEPEVLVVSVERDEEILTPRGDTEIRADDLVTLFARGDIPEKTIAAFTDD
ncbi:transcriptional regulator, AsnC family protein [Halogeometricum borinquense DSM 11551]|uniref:Transcriptional regulator, AsnC family n=2 Tax=Halogeometricum borinquense TaxID=60847 RepID=E4NVK2_HALBP|nr:TrkA C-terminal domain-containing protein [Halogeometricum borinquense]ADQ68886.1 transcriptional regulator, AsnC family [Halogeometricum borinquense DSM 11551]ELY28985.1 transcriptional regulator, AsnC family protein [Halogeometricum borinquense DSM 11551]RYJ08075.1 winged helix-turn-helix transcriptional regulator [Halogeometricum borinquense]